MYEALSPTASIKPYLAVLGFWYLVTAGSSDKRLALWAQAVLQPAPFPQSSPGPGTLHTTTTRVWSPPSAMSKSARTPGLSELASSWSLMSWDEWHWTPVPWDKVLLSSPICSWWNWGHRKHSPGLWTINSEIFLSTVHKHFILTSMVTFCTNLST